MGDGSRSAKIFLWDPAATWGVTRLLVNTSCLRRMSHLLEGTIDSDGISGPIALSGRADIGTINIGSDVWIGHGSIILEGVVIGDGAIIGAGISCNERCEC